MKITRPRKPNGAPYPNVIFITDENDAKHYISYNSEVAIIDADGNYKEMTGEKYFSRTIVMHKNLSKKNYHIGGK